ncbi:hypothetical protein MOV40_06655 [Bifidobacterium pseudolongum subsp. globosum]|uniref:hypothetical protein n=1 Tax=Bifidobacterium pseudolongum TaxID=1694 RepID=UPI0010223DB4|nr:hypothetical protein [Bifidobacterium pseudolongum]MCI1195177.1 hypothetical protein [Bifidobacterium pseudolongum subsp. globosum]RYQ06033.1 hypothetical protein PG2105B_1442 [Bifidobacterium pseudolongum subsp. globosum]UNP92932.1 hypothetical protein MPY70_08015 [Bifidobacterium pseudolongum subsp. globosum]UNZ09539.1 hypothetical protein MRS62_08005 [Bifidobacterium pseudolongum subsp. globosum]
MREHGERVASRRYTAGQVRLIASSPADGSQDFYVSVMVGMPVPLVAVERERLRRTVVDASRSTGRWS